MVRRVLHCAERLVLVIHIAVATTRATSVAAPIAIHTTAKAATATAAEARATHARALLFRLGDVNAELA
jgi:hypothetical protein